MTNDERTTQLKENLDAVRQRINAAAQAAGRDGAAIRLLPVTKFHPAEDVARLVSLGVIDLAENREQEARAKAEEVSEARIHMIGQVQSKKANSVARWAAGVHSVDSVKLAESLDRGMALALQRSDRTSEILPCYLQLSADGDSSRGGVLEADLIELAEAVEAAEHLHLAGLMVVPPIGAQPRQVFEWARRLCGELEEKFGRRMKFSAGMSEDLEEAIAAGSDIVRVGTGVLGNRPVA